MLLMVALAVRRPGAASVVLLALATLFMRPMIFGERYSLVSVGLAIAALGCAAIDGLRVPERSGTSAVVWVSLLFLWDLILALQPNVSVETVLRGIVDVPVVLAVAWLIAADPWRRRLFVKVTLGIVLVTCGSFVITFCLWRIYGFGSFQLATIPGSYKEFDGALLPGVPLYPPFTTTSSTVAIGDSLVPRFLGLGREPGVMAAIITWAYFMVSRVGWRRPELKVLLLAGLAGTQSTAGFGIFLLVLVVTKFFVGEWRVSTGAAVVRGSIGIAALAAAGYLAVVAPVFGLGYKNQSNEVSVNDRFNASMAGITSMMGHPLGQAGAAGLDRNAGINIIGALLVTGIPGLVCSIGALIGPLVASSQKVSALGSWAVVVLTCLIAQPLAESTGFFLLALIACANLGSLQSVRGSSTVGTRSVGKTVGGSRLVRAAPHGARGTGRDANTAGGSRGRHPTGPGPSPAAAKELAQTSKCRGRRACAETLAHRIHRDWRLPRRCISGQGCEKNRGVYSRSCAMLCGPASVCGAEATARRDPVYRRSPHIGQYPLGANGQGPSRP